jgi:DNA replication and repair protein RecF
VLRSLKLRDFRCFRQLEIQFHPEMTCFLGPNAIGKTSLLEAVAVLARLQSPRTGSFPRLIRFGAKGLVVDGYANEYHLQFYYSPTRRKLALDGVVQRTPEAYLAVARVVYLANADIELARGGAEQRRRFLDFAGTQLLRNYRDVLRSYERALRSRNAFLKMLPARPREIAAYTTLLLKFGPQLTALRSFLVELLEPAFVTAFAAISDAGESITLRYHPSAKTDFAAELAATADEERRLKMTVIGPHRDDVHVLINTRPADLFASEGQQRTIALALKLAQATLLDAEFKQAPVLLLDDIFGELDPQRRNRLLQSLPAGSQKLITSTSLDWVEHLPIGQVHVLKLDGANERQIEAL